jgi:hypothetical protein
MKIALVVLYLFSADGNSMSVVHTFKSVEKCERAKGPGMICWTVYVNK